MPTSLWIFFNFNSSFALFLPGSFFRSSHSSLFSYDTWGLWCKAYSLRKVGKDRDFPRAKQSTGIMMLVNLLTLRKQLPIKSIAFIMNSIETHLGLYNIFHLTISTDTCEFIVLIPLQHILIISILFRKRKKSGI